jgi:acyl phosphate:glycerol-3-phosphate acyltransferase
MLVLIILLLLGYGIGSIMTGLWISRLQGLSDPRLSGSRNPGTTNMWRLSGKKAGALTLLGDLLKGFVPVLCIQQFWHDPLLSVVLGTALLLGHSFPLFARFQGGKGIATVFGILLACWPMGAVFVFLIWVLTLLLWPIVSVASLVAALSLPFLAYWQQEHPVWVIGFSVWALWIWIRHSKNILRLYHGVEPSLQKAP